MSLDTKTIEALDDCQKRGDAGRAAYYRTLATAGDPYGRMALGVVEQSNMAGKVAYSYAKEVAKRYCRPISDDRWTKISVDLMRSDFAARRSPENYEAGAPGLQWFVIRDYHRLAFARTGLLPPEAWTAWIPLFIDGESKGQKLWHRMLTEDFLTVGVQTAWLVAGRIVHKAGVHHEMAEMVVPTLKMMPPVVTGQAPLDPAFGRCMAKLAPYQLRGSAATDAERMAVFYLDVLACASNVSAAVIATPLLGGVAAGAWNSFGPAWGPTVGDVERAL